MITFNRHINPVTAQRQHCEGTDDILTSIDQHGIVILILLDLSAAFDTIDHDVLFSRMESTLGITGPALEMVSVHILVTVLFEFR